MLFCLTADYIFATGVGTYSFCLWRYQASDRRDFREAGPWAAAGERQDEASFRSKMGRQSGLGRGSSARDWWPTGRTRLSQNS